MTHGSGHLDACTRLSSVASIFFNFLADPPVLAVSPCPPLFRSVDYSSICRACLSLFLVSFVCCLFGVWTWDRKAGNMAGTVPTRGAPPTSSKRCWHILFFACVYRYSSCKYVSPLSPSVAFYFDHFLPKR